MSEVKVNKISPRSGTTVTLGDSGDTFTIPSGATINNQGTATNFGATGSASWVTTVKTGDFTAVAGEGYFVNTTSGAINVTLPAGTAGAVVAIKDYAKTFDTNALTLIQNGSDKIGGSTTNATITTEGIAITLVFIDSTQGWLVTDDGLQSSASTASYVTATGGSITNSPCGDYKIHTFTGPGTFAVSAAGNPEGSNAVEYIVVAGGGSGLGGAGGAGGFRYASPSLAPVTYPAKPLAAPAGLAVPVASYPIVVGAGGTGGANGSVSTFSSITSTGGGRGGGASGNAPPAYVVVAPGGSGGGGGQDLGGAGGTGNTPPVSPPQGNNGGNGSSGPFGAGGGGGGALAAGSTGAQGNPAAGGAGGVGAGVPNAFGTSGQSSGGYYYFSGGGGGGPNTSQCSPQPVPAGGLGGGGIGASVNGGNGAAGTVNTGGGSGGNEYCTGTVPNSQAGGSGIVVIRYKFQN